MKPIAKPEKPKKYKLVTRAADYHFDWVSNKVALPVFLKWLEKSVPKGAQDVTIGIGEEFYYDDGTTWIQITWKQKEPNTRFVSETKRYQKELAKWRKQHEKA